MAEKSVLLLLLLLFISLQTKTEVKARSPIIRVPEDFIKIQDAINHAYPGDRILISAGAYYEHIIINKSISLIGESATNTILDGSGNDTVIVSLADHVAIIGISIVNCGTTYYSGLVGDSGILMRGSGNVVQEVRISGGVWGILLEDCGNSIIKHCNISSATSSGVYMEFCQNVVVEGNTFSDLDIGVFVHWSNKTLVENNIFDCRSKGMGLTFCYNTTITSNSLMNGNGLIDLHDCGDYLVYYNNFINFLWGPYVGTSRVDGQLPEGNSWDSGYPSGGNYWDSNRAYQPSSGERLYEKIDLYSGPYQNEAGSDEISDGQVVIRINPNIADRYPLMNPWGSPTIQVIFPLNGSETRETNVNVTWEVSDLSQVDHFEVQLDDGSWFNVGMSTSSAFGGLSDGNHIVRLKTISKLGLVKIDVISFVVNARYTKELVFIVLPLTLVSIIGVSTYFYLKKKRQTHR